MSINSTNFVKPSQVSTGFNLATATDSDNLLLQNGDDLLLQTSTVSFLLLESGFTTFSTNMTKGTIVSTNYTN